MQHKHIFAALLCGALCLTGCLKNEESASVTQVRNAKANELNAQADLLKAQAAAATTLANAEATLMQAKAELEKANAALVNAKAETEKVQAELLKVKVQLETVKVEEEKVALKIKEAELAAKLAELEVIQAKAEADIQAWVNMLNWLKTQAEIQSITSQQQLLQAQKDMDEFLLTAEAEEAEAIRDYADKYFAVCEDLIALQKEAIDTEVAINAFVNDANAYLDYLIGIYYDDQATLAYINEYIEWLKTYQTATPEELEAKWNEAWEALNEVIAVYDQAQTAYVEAANAADDFWDTKDSFYWQSWYGNFRYHLYNNWNIYAEPLEFIEGVEPTWEYGTYIENEEGEEEFLPLYRYEDMLEEPAYYYEVDLETGIYNPQRAQILYKTHLVPAKIYNENIEKLLQMEEEYYNNTIAVAKAAVDGQAAVDVANMEDQIDDIDEQLAKEADYLATRQPEVEKAEQAVVEAFEAYNKAVADGEEAIVAYREYMIMTYDISRTYFENIYYAKDVKDTKVAALAKAEGELAAAKAKVPTDEQIYEAKLEAAKKEAAYKAAKKEYEEGDTDDKLAAAVAKYDGKGNGSAEKAEKAAEETYKKALADWRTANIAATASPEDADLKQALKDAKSALDDAGTAWDEAKEAAAKAKKAYDTAKANDDEARKDMDAAKKAWDAAKKDADDLENYVVDPKYQDAVDAAKLEADDANTALENAENALAAAFEELKQDGVNYDDDPKFAELYKASVEANEGINKLSPWYYWDDEKADYVPGAAREALNNVYFLYNTVYRNKDGYSYPYRYLEAAYDFDPELMYINGYRWNSETQGYEVVWDYYYDLWEPEYDDDGNIINWIQVLDEDGNPLPDPSYSLTYQKAELEAAIEAMPETVAGMKEQIDHMFDYEFEEIETVRENLEIYAGYEAPYNELIAEAQELYDAAFEAQKAYLNAYWDYESARAEYQAIRDNLGGEIVKYEYDDETEDYYAVTLNDVNEAIEFYEFYAQLYEQWIEEDYQAILDYLDEANIDLEKMYMDYELLLKKIVILQKLADDYKAALEELLGVDLDVLQEEAE